MTREEGMKELIYQLTISNAKKLLDKGIISREEYDEFDTKMRQKYKPIFGTLWT